jgi:phage gpG-like protein
MKVDAGKFAKDIQKRLTDILVMTPSEKKELYNAQGEVMLGSLKRQFQTQGRYYLSGRWAPLTDSTKASYKKKGYKLQPTLRRTGRLFNSFFHSVGTDGPQLGTNVEYAEYLQFGTRHMSPRPFFPMPPFARQLSNEDIEKIRNVTILAYQKKISRIS